MRGLITGLVALAWLPTSFADDTSVSTTVTRTEGAVATPIGGKDGAATNAVATPSQPSPAKDAISTGSKVVVSKPVAGSAAALAPASVPSSHPKPAPANAPPKSSYKLPDDLGDIIQGIQPVLSKVARRRINLRPHSCSADGRYAIVTSRSNLRRFMDGRVRTQPRVASEQEYRYLLALDGESLYPIVQRGKLRPFNADWPMVVDNQGRVSFIAKHDSKADHLMRAAPLACNRASCKGEARSLSSLNSLNSPGRHDELYWTSPISNEDGQYVLFEQTDEGNYRWLENNRYALPRTSQRFYGIRIHNANSAPVLAEQRRRVRVAAATSSPNGQFVHMPPYLYNAADGSTMPAEIDLYTRVHGVSNDGRRMLLSSDRGMYVQQLDTGTTIDPVLSNIDTEADAKGDITGQPMALSADGRLVLYRSAAKRLVAHDADVLDDVFVYDTNAEKTYRVNTDRYGQRAFAKTAIFCGDHLLYTLKRGGAMSLYKRPLNSMLASDAKLVAAVQGALRAKGYRLRVDGQWGSRTTRALQRYQRKHGLRVGGLNLLTLRHLKIDPSAWLFQP